MTKDHKKMKMKVHFKQRRKMKLEQGKKYKNDICLERDINDSHNRKCIRV